MSPGGSSELGFAQVVRKGWAAEGGVDALTRAERPALRLTAYRGEIPSSAHNSSSEGRSPAQPNQ